MVKITSMSGGSDEDNQYKRLASLLSTNVDHMAFENTAIQMYWKFYHQKQKTFRYKILIFFICLLKTEIVGTR